MRFTKCRFSVCVRKTGLTFLARSAPTFSLDAKEIKESMRKSLNSNRAWGEHPIATVEYPAKLL
jgi:hypothetical protein